jgi:arabinan endo-1,5-alpha-L-arabinosidase
MASSASFAAPCALALALYGCRGPTDIVAVSHEGLDASTDLVDASHEGRDAPADVGEPSSEVHDAAADIVEAPYGDYNPDAPPQMLAIGGDIAVTDPTMFRWQDTYWVFSSGPGISVRSSKDLKTFQLEKQVFAQNPGWIALMVPKVGDLWSPYVLSWDRTTIHLYYAASWPSTTCGCIGHATASSIASVQTFVDDGIPVICSNSTTTCVDQSLTSTDPFTAIDPAVILDEAGDPWMVFGSWGSGIMIIELDRDGTRLDPNSTPVVVAARAPGDSKAIQAASLYHFRDYYYLFVSFEGSSYHVLRVGRAKKVTGPYLDSDGKDMKNGGGRLVLQGDANFKGPGSNMVFDDPSQRLNVYHAYDATQSNQVTLRIAQLVFDNDGWPKSAGP